MIKSRTGILLLSLGCLLLLAPLPVAGQQSDPGAPVPPPDVPPDQEFRVWPGQAPDEPGGIGPEIMLVERRRPFYQITNVTEPTVSVYLPEKSKATGAAMLVLPGGGLVRLAIEHEGYEVADWLRSQGIAAFMLKYRVPPRTAGRSIAWKAGLQDAQRAMSLVRSRAQEFGIDPDGIGAIGFSAGGELATWLALRADERQYAAIDAADTQPLRPNFVINIYPGGLAFGRGAERKLRQDVVSRIGPDTPPMFFVHAFPDDSLNSLLMATALKQADVPAELHLFQAGAHGFGVRTSGSPLANWPTMALDWMGSLGFLDRPELRQYSRQLGAAFAHDGAKLPLLSSFKQDVGWEEAYASQRRVVAAHFSGQKVIGYKGAASSLGAQQSMGIDRPMHCVIFASGENDAATAKALPAQQHGVVETEIGYVMGVDIATEIEDADEARTATQTVMPVIELPLDFASAVQGKPTATDTVASNCGGLTRIVKGPAHHPDTVDLDALAITLTRDGKPVHSVTGAGTRNGQWENLKILINQIVASGRILREGDIILSGAIGAPAPGPPGRYVAEYGELGNIDLELTATR